MFKLKLGPFFAAQRALLLTESTASEFPLPLEIKNQLNQFETELEAPTAVSRNKLWILTLRAVKSNLIKTTFLGFGLATTSTGAALCAMQLLKLDSTSELLYLPSIGFTLLSLLSIWLGFLIQRSQCSLGISVNTFLTALISKKFLQVDSRAVQVNYSKGNLKVLVSSDVQLIAKFFSSASSNVIPALTLLIIMGPFMYHFTGIPGLVAILTTFFSIPLSFLSSKINSHYQSKSQKSHDSLVSLIGEWIKNIRLIRYLSWQNAMSEEISKNMHEMTQLNSKIHLNLCFTLGLSILWWMFSVLAMAMASKIMGIPMVPEKFFFAIWLIVLLQNYLMYLPDTIKNLGMARPSVRRISSFLSAPNLSSFFQKDALIDFRNVIPKYIHFRNVSFSYDEDPLVLDQLNVAISLNQKTAIIGVVASGKSTFLKLLCGEMPPSRGSIEVEFDDGAFHPYWAKNIYTFMQGQFAHVPQETFISNDELAANISLSHDSDESAIFAAAYRAELELDIKSMAAGIREELGESGVNLSGGQQQRVNIARAFYSRRPFLLMDDPLSAVDIETESRLMTRFVAHSGGLVFISHRIRELKAVDRILVLDSGKIVEDGTPENLLAKKDSYLARALRAYGEDLS